MAVLVLLAGTARTRIVAAYPLVHMDRSPGLLLAVRGKILAAGPHVAHVLASWSLGRTRLAVIPQWHESPEEE